MLQITNRTDNFELVYDLVKGIPAGKVATYGQIGRYLGINPRYVGFILHKNPDSKNIPCHRVVNAKGEIAQNFVFGGGNKQREKLENEDIVFINNKIDLVKFGMSINH